MGYIQAHPQATETEYPYTAQNGQCRSVAGHVRVGQVITVKAHSSNALLNAIAQQPVSVTVAASSSVFGGYKTGVVNSAACGTSLNHAITAVGYGTLNGQQYYLVRNSWGAGWGDQGYIRIATQRIGPGICGIQQVSVYPKTN